jgi:hypothetical protein
MLITIISTIMYLDIEACFPLSLLRQTLKKKGGGGVRVDDSDETWESQLTAAHFNSSLLQSII